MLPKIIFLTAVTAATIAVILLAFLSPSINRNPPKTNSKPPLALSLYLQHPALQTDRPRVSSQAKKVIVFHHTLTDMPHNRARIVGKAQGFIIPVDQFAHSAFNVIYLTFDTPDYSGGLSVEAKEMRNVDVEELKVVGGTGSFAFARGWAIFVKQQSDARALYHVKLKLRFPD